MKRVLVILYFSFAALYTYSQDHVFVLVDVSGSVKKEDMSSAKQALIDVLLGNQLSNANVPSSLGTVQDLAQCKMKTGGKLAIMKFGNKQTILSNNPIPVVIQNLPGDIYQTVNTSYPLLPTDNKTYLTLAKAKVAEYAKSIQLKQYRLYIISDNISDDYGKNGKPDYTDYERSLAESYGTTSSGVKPGSSTKVKLNFALNKDFVIEFVPTIDISKYTLPPGSGIIIPPDSTPQIRISSYSGGTKIKPVKVNGSNLNISWSCSNCPQGAKFTVTVSGMSGNKFRPKIPVIASQSYSLSNLPGGDYRITVGGQNLNASSDMVYVTVDSGGGGVILWVLLLLVAAGVAGWWFWNKKRVEKLDEDKVNKQDDIFSQGNSGGSVTSNSSDW